MKIVSLNGFRIPGIEYPRKSYGEFEDLKNPDTEMVYFDAPDNFLHFQEETYENDLVGVQHARDAWKLEKERPDIDAIIIACNGEPGVKAARELCDTLVVGSAGAVMHVASMLGRKFSYIISGAEGEGEDAIIHGRETYLTVAEHYGLAHKLASIRNIDTPPMGFNEAIISDEEWEALRTKVFAEAKAAVFEDGAEVIIGYGGPRLHEALVEEMRPLGVPVLSTGQTLIKFAEMLVQLGLSHSKRTYPKPRQIYDFTIEAHIAESMEDRAIDRD